MRDFFEFFAEIYRILEELDRDFERGISSDIRYILNRISMEKAFEILRIPDGRGRSIVLELTFWNPHMDKLHEALISFRRILRASDIHAKKLGKVAGLKTSQLLVLQALDEFGEMTVGDIAGKVNLAQASTTALVDKLQAMQFVMRVRGDTDRRKVFVRLTPDGRTVLDRAPMPLHDRFSEKFNALEDWEQSFLIAALQRISGMMDASDYDAAPLLDHEVIVDKE